MQLFLFSLNYKRLILEYIQISKGISVFNFWQKCPFPHSWVYEYNNYFKHPVIDSLSSRHLNVCWNDVNEWMDVMDEWVIIIRILIFNSQVLMKFWILLCQKTQFQPLLQNSSFKVFVSEVKTKNSFFRPLGPLIVGAFEVHFGSSWSGKNMLINPWILL